MSATIKNLDKLQAAFAQLDDVAKQKNLTAAVMAGANPIVNEAKDNAHVLSGTLQRSINAQIAEASNSMVSARIGTSVGYGILEEFRDDPWEYTGDRDIIGDDSESPKPSTIGEHDNHAPHAYLRPAYDSARNEAERKVVKMLTFLVEKAAQ